jgi:hypothetical protein
MSEYLKSLVPAAVGLLAGVAVLIVGAVTGDDTVKTVGLSIIGTALPLAGIAFRVPNTPGAAPAGENVLEPAGSRSEDPALRGIKSTR